MVWPTTVVLGWPTLLGSLNRNSLHECHNLTSNSISVIFCLICAVISMGVLVRGTIVNLEL